MTELTPRMIFGMNADAIAATIAAFGQAAHCEASDERYVYISFANSAARILQLMIGTDDATRLIEEQIALLQGCIEVAMNPEKLGEGVMQFLKAL